jgi:chromosome partitioning protein
LPSESSEFGSKAGHPNWWNPGRGARNRVCSESRLNYKTAIDRSRGDQRLLKILVANRKGGCGKTTVATQLASALAVSGHAVCLADADRQRSSLGWLACRPPEAPPITALDWTKEIGKPPKGEGFLVIDAVAGLHGKRAVEMVKLADLLILPMLPSAFDEGVTRRFLDRIKKVRRIASGRIRVGIVGNRIRGGTHSAGGFERFVAGLGAPIVARVRDSQLYVQSAATGVSIFDARGRRWRALRADWYPLLAFVEQDAARL